MYSQIKRIFDIIFAIIIIACLSPILILVSIIIKLTDYGPVFFLQNRLGYKGKIFKIYKFRTMIFNAPDLRNSDGTTFNSSNDPRLTKIGKFLREYSIDELPQLLNVIFGEMSIIGPRPELPESYETHTSNELKRLNVLPGITGWAAVNGRNKLPIRERRILDVYYAENLSLNLDFKIFYKTILLLIRKESIYSK